MLDDVSFAYGNVPVLDHVSLNIAAGELFLLLGPSGCGKTTILRLIAGFLHPLHGAVRIAGQDQCDVPTERRGLGMVFQNYALWPHLNVAGNIAFPLEIAKVPATERARRVDEALAMVSLAGLGSRSVGDLSGGQQQRVALARALVLRPRVLLLDEPLSNLDAKLRGELRQEIRRVCKAANVTGVYVTHDQGEALAVADRIALVLGGRIAQLGTPQELYERPLSRAVAAFLGEANILPATSLGSDRARCVLGDVNTHMTTALSAGAACTLMVRPEHLRIVAEGTPATLIGGDYHGVSATWEAQLGDQRLRLSESPPVRRQIGDRVHLAIAAGAAVALSS